MYKFIQSYKSGLFIFRKALTIICNHLHYHIYYCRSSVYYNSIILRSAYMDWWNWLCIVYQLLSTIYIYIYWYCLLLTKWIYWLLIIDHWLWIYYIYIYVYIDCLYIYISIYHYWLLIMDLDLYILLIGYGSGYIYICSYYILLVHTT